MPSPHPSLFQNFLRIMRWMALFAIAVAALAVVFVARGDTGLHIHMLIVTALAGLTVLLATALMTLAFLSSKSGHGDQAAPVHEEDKQ